MTEAMLKRILEEAQAKKGEGGEQELGEGRKLTVYAAHAGVPLTVSKVVGVRMLDGATVQVRNDKGERTFIALDDMFAAGVEGAGPSSMSRKAGFVGQ
jgi:hypothetical protein